MAEKVIVSEQGKVSLLEWLKSAAYAIGIAVATELQKYIDAGSLDIDWKKMAMVAFGAFITLVLGKLVAKPSVKTIYDNNYKAVTVAEDIKESNK